MLFLMFFLLKLKKKTAPSLFYCHLNPAHVILETVLSLLICFFRCWWSELGRASLCQALSPGCLGRIVCAGTKDLVMSACISSHSTAPRDLNGIAALLWRRSLTLGGKAAGSAQSQIRHLIKATYLCVQIIINWLMCRKPFLEMGFKMSRWAFKHRFSVHTAHLKTCMDIHVDWAHTHLRKQGAEGLQKTTMNEGNVTALHSFIGLKTLKAAVCVSLLHHRIIDVHSCLSEC